MTIPAWICLAMLGFRGLIAMAISRIAASGTCPTLPVDAVSVRTSYARAIRTGSPAWMSSVPISAAPWPGPPRMATRSLRSGAMSGKTPVSLRAKALWAAAALAFPQPDHRRMAELAAEGIELARQSEDPIDLRNLLTIAGMVAMCQGRYTDALETFRKCIGICRPLGMSWQLATSHLNLGTALLHVGRTDAADATLQEGLRLYRELGDEIFAARVTNVQAQASLVRQDIEGANDLARHALLVVAEQGERQGIAEGLETLAAVAAARAEPDRAARLSGAAAAIRETIASRPTFEVAITGPFLESVRRIVTGKRWHELWEAGRALSAEDAVAYALGSTSAERDSSSRMRRA